MGIAFFLYIRFLYSQNALWQHINYLFYFIIFPSLFIHVYADLYIYLLSNVLHTLWHIVFYKNVHIISHPKALFTFLLWHSFHGDFGSVPSLLEPGWACNYNDVTPYEFWCQVKKVVQLLVLTQDTWNLTAMLWGSLSSYVGRPCAAGPPADSLNHKTVWRPSDLIAPSWQIMSGLPVFSAEAPGTDQRQAIHTVFYSNSRCNVFEHYTWLFLCH